MGNKAPPTSRESNEVACVLSSSLSFSVGFSVQDEAVNVARSAPQGDHYYADVIYLLS